jgi:hypothetical protein
MFIDSTSPNSPRYSACALQLSIHCSLQDLRKAQMADFLLVKRRAGRRSSGACNVVTRPMAFGGRVTGRDAVSMGSRAVSRLAVDDGRLLTPFGFNQRTILLSS